MVKRYINCSFLEGMEFLFDYFNSFFKDSNKRNLFINLLKDLSNYLSDMEKKFWDLFLDITSGNKGYPTQKLFYYDNMDSFITNNIWTSEINYLKLRENLENCQINYVDSNVNNLRKTTSGKFDLIYLSNILRMANENYAKLLIYLGKILKSNGIVYDYNWKINDYFKEEDIKRFYSVDIKNLELPNTAKSEVYINI